MNLDQSFVTILVSFITGGAVWFLVRPNSQKLTGDAYSSLTNSINLLSRRVDELEKEKSKIYDELEKEREARAADKVLHEAEIVKVRLELQTERTERIKAGQRISALEDELDKRDLRIKELESGGETRRGGSLLK